MDAVPFVFENDLHPPWSIMIVLYPYITGLVAGAFVVSALYHVFHNNALKPVARLALVTSLCFAAFATLPLNLHLHHPEHAYLIMVTTSVTSAIAGFGIIYGTYMLVLVVEVWLVFRPTFVEGATAKRGVLGLLYRVLSLGSREITAGAARADAAVIRALAIIGIPVACILHGYVGFLFGALKSNPWWSSAIMPIIFLVSAIVSGIAALVVLYLFISWRRGVPADAPCIRELLRYLWLFLVLTTALEGLEILHMAYEGGGEWHVLKTLLTERLAISYGVVQVLIGSIFPLIILPIAIQKGRSVRSMLVLGGFGSVLVLIQVLAMRWNVVVGGQVFSKSFRGFVDYNVHWGGREGWIAGALVLAAPLVALWVASKIVPLSDDES